MPTTEERIWKNMKNSIVIELCAEDRARLDRLAEAMEKKTCDRCVSSAIECMKQPTVQEEPKSEPVHTEPTKQVDRAELRAKVIELSAKGFKEQTKDIVRLYAPTVSSVPEDKISECYEKLCALEA